MRSCARVFSVCLLVFVFAVAMVACSKEAVAPTDAEVIKVIQATIEGNTQGLTLKSPVVIVEKPKPLPNKEWQVKVDYSVADKDGNVKKEVVSYKLSPSISDMGANIWLVSEMK